MSRRIQPGPTDFHAGELAVQQRASFAAAAAGLSGMLAPAQLRGGLLVIEFAAPRRVRLKGILTATGGTRCGSRSSRPAATAPSTSSDAR